MASGVLLENVGDTGPSEAQLGPPAFPCSDPELPCSELSVMGVLVHLGLLGLRQAVRPRVRDVLFQSKPGIDSPRSSEWSLAYFFLVPFSTLLGNLINQNMFVISSKLSVEKLTVSI